MKCVYKHGGAFDLKLEENLNDCNSRILGKKASLIILDGGIGEGKTTLLVECLDYINKIRGLPPISLAMKKHPQLALGGEQFPLFLKVCHDKNLPAIGYDEAGDFSKRGALTKFNAMLNRIFETYRGFKILVVIALPNFAMLDSVLFDNKIPRGLLHLYDRGESYGNFKAYSLSQMNWIRYWFDKLPKGAKHRAYSKCDPNFLGHFLDLSPERSKQLDKLSTEGKKKVLIKTAIKMEGLVSYVEIAKRLCRSVIWVRKMTTELNLRHKKIIERSKYFDEGVINILGDKLDEMEDNRKYRKSK